MKFKILWIPIVIPANSEEDNNTVRSRQIAEVLPHHLRSIIVFETPPELRVQPKPLLH